MPNLRKWRLPFMSCYSVSLRMKYWMGLVKSHIFGGGGQWGTNMNDCIMIACETIAYIMEKSI